MIMPQVEDGAFELLIAPRPVPVSPTQLEIPLMRTLCLVIHDSVAPIGYS